jgi:hypothetical protein
MGRRFSVLLVFLFALLVAGVLPARADDYSKVRIVRLSFAEGTVKYQRPGEAFQTAVMNLPIQQGFVLQTGNGFAEVEFEEGLAIRLAGNSSVEFTELSLMDAHRVTHLTLTQGTAIVTANLTHNDELSVASPNLSLNVPRNGKFRVDVTPTGNSVTVFNGKIDDTIPTGNASLTSHQTLHLATTETISQQVGRSPAPDAFDKWVSQREQILANAEQEASPYLKMKDYTAGYAELSGYGDWANIRGYGMGWQPYGVGLGWTPYGSGAWSYMPFTGWNWISAEPWGWLPYHFGGWIDDPDYGWIWIPSDMLGWQPANASWAIVNNQVGWIPTAPVVPANPKRVPPTLAPGVFISGAKGPSGTIVPSGRMPLGQNAVIRMVHISPPASTPVTASLSAGAAVGTSSNSFAADGAANTSAPASSGPVAIHAPGSSNSAVRAAGPVSAPFTQAPHSLPASPSMMSSAWGHSNGGSSGGPNGGSGSHGNANPATGSNGYSSAGTSMPHNTTPPPSAAPNSMVGASGAATGTASSTGSAGGTTGGHH